MYENHVCIAVHTTQAQKKLSKRPKYFILHMESVKMSPTAPNVNSTVPATRYNDKHAEL